MITGSITSYRSDMRAGHDGFSQLLRAEWTKVRTVRGWVIGLMAGALVIVLLGLFAAASSHAFATAGPAITAFRWGRAARR